MTRAQLKSPAQLPSVTFVQGCMDWLVLLEGTEMNVHRAHHDEKKMFTEEKGALQFFFPILTQNLKIRNFNHYCTKIAQVPGQQMALYFILSQDTVQGTNLEVQSSLVYQKNNSSNETCIFEAFTQVNLNGETY